MADIFGNHEDRHIFGNSPQDAFGNASNADVFGNSPSDVFGNYTPGASGFVPNGPEIDSDGGGLLETLGELVQGFFGLFG